MSNKKLTVNQVVKELNLKVDSIQELKLKKLLNSIYVNGYVSDDKVLNVVLKIYLADPTLNALDDVYVIPYGGNVKIDFKYSFWPKKLTELGVFKQVDAYVVREGEEFTIEINNGETNIVHKANPFKTDGAIIGAYARGIKDDGTVVIATANKNELAAAAKAAKVKSRGKATIWDMWFEEVAKKVPLKRLVKLIPVPSEINQAVNIESDNYASPEEVREAEKADDAIMAMEELNQEASKKPTLQEVLDSYDIPYELRQGYVKVDKELINKSELADEKLPLMEYPKTPGFLIGKASNEVNIELKGAEDEIVYEPVNDEKLKEGE